MDVDISARRYEPGEARFRRVVNLVTITLIKKNILKKKRWKGYRRLESGDTRSMTEKWFVTVMSIAMAKAMSTIRTFYYETTNKTYMYTSHIIRLNKRIAIITIVICIIVLLLQGLSIHLLYKRCILKSTLLATVPKTHPRLNDGSHRFWYK